MTAPEEPPDDEPNGAGLDHVLALVGDHHLAADRDDRAVAHAITS